VLSSTSLPESSSIRILWPCFARAYGRGKLFEPEIGVRIPYFVRDEEDPVFLFDEEKKLPRRKKDLIDGKETTMMATAISAIDSTSTHLSGLRKLQFS
jgi:hypothetical protein